jgi:hypothetical protein
MIGIHDHHRVERTLRKLGIVRVAMNNHGVLHMLFFEICLGVAQPPVFVVDDVLAVNLAGLSNHVRENDRKVAPSAAHVRNLAALMDRQLPHDISHPNFLQPLVLGIQAFDQLLNLLRVLGM